MLVDGPTAEPLTNNLIGDWVQGDNRQFLRTLSDSLLEAGDYVTDAWLTLKISPTVSDQNAVFQTHVTVLPSVYGSVGAMSGGSQLLTINAFGNQTVVTNPGTQYWYEIKVLTFGGTLWSVEQGYVDFGSRVGDIVLGPLIPISGYGVPDFRGYAAGPPPNSPGLIFYTGDWIRNNNPSSGSPSGWVCVIGGVPGTWQNFGIVGDDSGIAGAPLAATGVPRYQGFQVGVPLATDQNPNLGDWAINLNPTAGSTWAWVFNGLMWVTDSIVDDNTSIASGANPTMGPPPTFWGYAYGPPLFGVYQLGDWSRNILPASGAPSGWVCIAAGSPGTWVTDGIIGDTA